MVTTGPGPGPTPAPRVDGITFTPTTSQATPPRPSAGRFVIPAVLVAAAAAAAIVFVVRGQKHAPDPTPASAPLAIASAPSAPQAGQPSAPASAVAATTLAPIASAGAQPPAIAAAAPSASSSQPAKPAWMQQGMQGKFGGWPRPSSTAQPTTAPPAAPTCQVVTYYDTDGTKHFKQECH